MGTPPLQDLDRLKIMVFELGHEFLVKGLDIGRDAERAVVQVAARAACDLSELGRGQIAVASSVEFALAGEGDVIDVEIEAHADRIGGDEKVDIARLIKRDLRVSRA